MAEPGQGKARLVSVPDPTTADAMTQVHRLFYAIQLDAAVAGQAIAVREALRAEQGLAGRVVAAERLHVTLHWLQDHAGAVPESLMSAALRAGGMVEEEPFAVAFDTIGSLGDSADPGPVVLTGGAGLKPLRRLQRALAAAMTDAGIGRFVRQRFKPHVTLLYEVGFVERRKILPVSWTVGELALVDSLVGRGQHIVRGRWPLQGRQMGFTDW